MVDFHNLSLLHSVTRLLIHFTDMPTFVLLGKPALVLFGISMFIFTNASVYLLLISLWLITENIYETVSQLGIIRGLYIVLGKFWRLINSACVTAGPLWSRGYIT